MGGVCAPAWSPGWMEDAAMGRRVRARLSIGSHTVSGGWRPPATAPCMGLCTSEPGYAAWPAWPRLALVSPALSLASQSCAVTLELTNNSGTDDLQSPSPCMQARCCLQEVLQLMDALPGVLMTLWLSLLGCPWGPGSTPNTPPASGHERRLLCWGLWQGAAGAVTLVRPRQPPPARRQPAPQ